MVNFTQHDVTIPHSLLTAQTHTSLAHAPISKLTPGLPWWWTVTFTLLTHRVKYIFELWAMYKQVLFNLLYVCFILFYFIFSFAVLNFNFILILKYSTCNRRANFQWRILAVFEIFSNTSYFLMLVLLFGSSFPNWPDSQALLEMTFVRRQFFVVSTCAKFLSAKN